MADEPDERFVVLQHDWASGEPLYVTVVTGVADVLGVDLRTLPPLADVVDPDGLESILRTSRDQELRVQFTYEGCRVAVDAGGAVSVVSPDEPRD